MEIFCTGKHRQKDYTDADLAQIVGNFRKFSSPRARPLLLRVPCVIGHEEDQEYLQRTDLPAAGWVTDLWVEGGHLLADAEDVPREVQRLLQSKVYRTVSAEIYDEPPEGIPGRGKMLRRVAFLGGEIPQVKGLKDIPTPEAYSERPALARRVPAALAYRGRVRAGRGVWVAFSEVRKMADQRPAAEQPQQPQPQPQSRRAPGLKKRPLVPRPGEGRELTDAERQQQAAPHAEGDPPYKGTVAALRPANTAQPGFRNKQAAEEDGAAALGRRSGRGGVSEIPRGRQAQRDEGAPFAEGDPPYKGRAMAYRRPDEEWRGENSRPSRVNKQAREEEVAAGLGRRSGNDWVNSQPRAELPEHAKPGYNFGPDEEADDMGEQPQQQPQMMREDHCRKLAEHGLDQSLIDEMPDHHVAGIADLLGGLGRRGEGEPDGDEDEMGNEPPGPEEGMGDEMPPGKGRDEEDDDPLASLGDDEEEWPLPRDEQEQQKFREHVRRYGERYKKLAAKYGEMDPEDDRDERSRMEEEEEEEREKKGNKQAAAKMSERARKDLADTRALRKFAEDKAARVDELLELLAGQGKLPPGQEGAVRRRLLRADAVTKFSEGGKQVTEYDLQVRELKALPSLFGERFRQPARVRGSADEEREKVREHFEAFSERFVANGITEDKLLAAFDSKRKADATLTAERFLGS